MAIIIIIAFIVTVISLFFSSIISKYFCVNVLKKTYFGVYEIHSIKSAIYSAIFISLFIYVFSIPLWYLSKNEYYIRHDTLILLLSLIEYFIFPEIIYFIIDFRIRAKEGNIYIFSLVNAITFLGVSLIVIGFLRYITRDFGIGA